MKYDRRLLRSRIDWRRRRPRVPLCPRHVLSSCTVRRYNEMDRACNANTYLNKMSARKTNRLFHSGISTVTGGSKRRWSSGRFTRSRGEWVHDIRYCCRKISIFVGFSKIKHTCCKLLSPFSDVKRKKHDNRSIKNTVVAVYAAVDSIVILLYTVKVIGPTRRALPKIGSVRVKCTFYIYTKRFQQTNGKYILENKYIN